MRVYETAHDHRVLPEVYMVARIDGRNFTRLTKDVHAFESPYDARFRDLMLDTVEHLMDCGFRVVYGYTQSDEISLLFHRDEQAFGRPEVVTDDAEPGGLGRGDVPGPVGGCRVGVVDYERLL